MGKNITIAEGAQAKNFFNIQELQTELISGGMQIWIPEDEAGNYVNKKNISIDENGTYTASSENCDAFSKVSVNVSPKTASKQINVNGTYNASDDGVDGYSSVEVNVPSGGGGGGGDANEYYYPITRIDDIPTSNANNGGTVFNGRSYAIFTNNQQSALYSTTNGAWSKVADFPSGVYCNGAQLVVFNNRLYVVGARNSASNTYGLWLFNGGTFTYVIDTPFGSGGACGNAAFSGGIYNYSGYVYDGHQWVTMPAVPGGGICAEYGGQLYGLHGGSGGLKICRFDGGSWNDVFTTSLSNATCMFTFKGKLHIFAEKNHYTYNGKFARREEPLPYELRMAAPSSGNSIYIMGFTNTPGGSDWYNGQCKATYTT